MIQTSNVWKYNSIQINLKNQLITSHDWIYFKENVNLPAYHKLTNYSVCAKKVRTIINFLKQKLKQHGPDQHCYMPTTHTTKYEMSK